MKGKKKRATLYALLAQLVALNVVASGCGYAEESTTNMSIESFEDLEKETNVEIQKLEIEDTIELDTIIQEEVQIEEKIPLFKEIPSVVANTNVNIRKSPSIDGELAGKLVEGHTLEMLGNSNGWYKVLYYGKECYISGDYVTETTTYQVNRDIQKVCYSTEELEITIPAEISESGVEEKTTIPSMECLEIYEENEDSYLVQTNDYIGYVAKTSLEELTGVFVVVDISDQELKLYENNKVILETPVVTGNPSKYDCASDEGLFEIYTFKKNDYLRGPGYASYVDIMMKYNRGEGLHDAEYHTCDNGKQTNHGWRYEWEFGGDTYLTNGSHGCINMPHDAVIAVYNSVEEGTRVFVHK